MKTSDADRSFFQNQLIEANRALITLGAIDLRERNPLTSCAVRDCLQVYILLLHCQASMNLSPDEAHSLVRLLDRLKAHLESFGEDV